MASSIPEGDLAIPVVAEPRPIGFNLFTVCPMSLSVCITALKK